MKSLLNKLKEICTSYPFSEKRIIVDSYRSGEQILHAFTGQGNHAINIKIMTLKEIAKTIVDQYSLKYNELISPPIGSFLTISLLKKLKEEKKLQYFHELEISPNLSRSIYNTIQTLRLSGFISENLPLTAFSTSEKANDFKVILKAYEAMLNEKKLWDDSLLFTEARKLMEDRLNPNSVYIFQPNLSFLDLEEQLVSALMQEQSYILPIAPVFGAEIPTRYPFIRDAQGEPTALSFLYEENIEKTNKKDLDLFASVSEESELNEVLRRIKEKDVSFDSCAIFYNHADPYNISMFQTAEQLVIPVTYGEGLPITVSSPGKMIDGMLTWLKNQCNVASFIPLIQEGIIDFGKEAPSHSSIITMLKNAEIGWGQDRYVPQIQKHIDFIKVKVDQTEGEKKGHFQKLEKEYTWLKKWFTKLFNQLPVIDNDVIELKSLLELFKYILSNYSRILSPIDVEAKNVLIEQIDSILPFASESITSYDAFLQIEELLLTIKIGASGPKPGSIHITSYKQATFIDRSNLFFIGFDHHRFPGKMIEDPLLLDHERDNLHPNLPLQTEKAKENLYSVLQLLASSNGHPTISYSIFDQSQNRSNNPSHFFLKCYRYQTGENDADFETIKNNYKNIVLPSGFINQKEWWQSNLYRGTLLPNTLLMKKYKHIAEGENAKKERETIRFTEYEGKIQVEESKLDPRKNKEVRMSSGRLEKLAACPYKYFLEDVLKVRPSETLVYDPNVWLDAKTRGILLHEIFEQFYKTIQQKREAPSFEKHEVLLISIVHERINSWQDQVVPPSKWVFDQEVNEIIESSRIFLKSEEEHGDGVEPIHFEYSFGIGEQRPAEIQLQNGEMFHLSGKIDRVDKDLDNNLSIIDYKTGKATKYELKKYFSGGRQLQHFLYAKALESHLQLEEGKVKKSSYLFPTVKGTGERRERRQDEVTRENGNDIVERLLDVLKFGNFMMTDNMKMDCMYCDYKHVCKRSSYSEDVFEGKGMDPRAEGVKRWKGVRAYE